MVKVTVLHGSPRKNGNSDTLTNYFNKGLRSCCEVEIKDFYANVLNIKPCQGCLACDEPLESWCKIQDDMQKIYSSFIESDLIIFATPMYWGYITAQLKTIIDRMEAIANPKYFEGKNFVVIITYRYHYESTVGFFKRIQPYFKFNLDFLTCCTLDIEKDIDIPIVEIKEKLEEAFELGKEMGKRLSTI